MPQISIIIPTYNAQATIKETIASVINQTFTDWELLIINDGSTDKTVEIINSIPDHRIKIFSYPNGGVCVARNRGIAQATGNYIAFLDADDVWLPDKLELQLNALQKHPDAAVAYSWTYFMYQNTTSCTFHPCPPISFTGNVYKKLLVNDFIGTGSNVLVRKQAIDSIGNFNPVCGGGADWEYWLRLAARYQFVAVPQYHILYRQTVGAMSSQVEKMRQECLVAVDKAYQSVPPQLQHLKKQRLAGIYRYCADLYLLYHTDSKGITQALSNWLSAIYLQPQSLYSFSTHRTLIKLLIKRLFTPKLAEFLLNSISKTRTIPDPRLQM